MIENISPEKWEELVRERENFVKIGSCTDPADFERAEKAIAKLYKLMNYSENITFERVPSPLAAQKMLREKYGATEYVDTTFCGQQDIYWIGYLKFLSTIPGIEADQEKMGILDIWYEIALSCSWWYAVNEQVVIICDRPSEVHWNDNRMLHNSTGMAVKYRDGHGMYVYGGVRIPDEYTYIITDPSKITVSKIKKQSNAELRRIMIEQMGIHKYLDKIGAKVIDMDVIKAVENSDATITRALMVDNNGQKYLVGSDGSTNRVYYMETNPEANTCVEAHNAISPIDESLIDGNS